MNAGRYSTLPVMCTGIPEMVGAPAVGADVGAVVGAGDAGVSGPTTHTIQRQQLLAIWPTDVCCFGCSRFFPILSICTMHS